jgi:predicted DNA-binding transcriptional regulator YafY
MGRKGQSITLSISEWEKTALETLANEFGMTWGDNPNISKLIKAIAHQQLKIAPNHDWSETRIQALKQAVDNLIDAGQVQVAIEIANLLLERGELSVPFRNEIEHIISNPPSAWLIELERYILRQQPFQLSYQDAAGRIWQFQIYYAQINRHEDRFYLDCWCEQTEGNQDIAELQHNWCLRLDRIPPETAIAPLQVKWRMALDSIPVEIHLFNGLVFAYKSKTGADIINELLPQDPPIRRVVRKVTSTFWFFREILRYGEDCLIIAPESVRTRFQNKIIELFQNYQ